jgi:cytochrome c oxidase subunit II
MTVRALSTRLISAVSVLVLASVLGCGGTTTTTSAVAPATLPSTSVPNTIGTTMSFGEALALKLCNSCHSTDGTKGVGPTWKGLAGSQVTLADGSKVVANDAYLTTAIEDPDKQIVQGYQAGVMSATIKPGSIAAPDVAALVAYIDSLK